MKRLLTTCTLLACVFLTHAYEIEATISIEGDTKWYFDIELVDNDIDFTAFQMDITLDSDVEITTDNLTRSKLAEKHIMLIGKPDGHYRILGYNLQNKALKGTQGELFSLTLDGDIKGITINKIIFSKADGTEVEAKDYIRPLDRDNDDAIAGVAADEDTKPVTYTLDGKQVYRIDRRGIYIQNGKKILVK